MPMEAAGAAALRMNSAKIRMVVNFFISKSPCFNYLPMPMEAAGAAALKMNSAKMRMVVSFFISNLLISTIYRCRWKRRAQQHSG